MFNDIKKKVSQFWDERLAEVDEKISIGKEALKIYDETEVPKIHQQTKELKTEFPPEFIKKCRVEYLEGKLKEVESYYAYCLEWYKELTEKDYPYYLKERSANDAKKALARLKKIKGELRWLENPKLDKEQITFEMIKIAKEFPIKQLLNTTKDFVKCPYHNDANPSFYLKGNFGYCFSCQKAVDTIDLVRHLENLDFPNAVKRLQ